MINKILVIDDEKQIRRFLRISLVSQGYDVIEAETGQTGIAQAMLSAPDLIVLDLGLPDMDGKTVLREIVNSSSIPVLVLSVRSSEDEKVQVLDIGAEDYVVKPFSVNELLARIRRILTSRAKSPVLVDDILYQDQQLQVVPAERRIELHGQPISLTKKEWAVLTTLLRSPGRLITQAHLLESIWGKTHKDDAQYLRNVIRQLRIKFGDDAANPTYIETEPGVGYRFIDRRQTS